MTPLGKGRLELVSGIRETAPLCPKPTTAFSSFTLTFATGRDTSHRSRLSGAVAYLVSASKAVDHLLTASARLAFVFRQPAACSFLPIKSWEKA